MASVTFQDLIRSFEDYMETEGDKEVFDVLNELTEHFIPGIEDFTMDAQVVVLDFEDVH